MQSCTVIDFTLVTYAKESGCLSKFIKYISMIATHNITLHHAADDAAVGRHLFTHLGQGMFMFLEDVLKEAIFVNIKRPSVNS